SELKKDPGIPKLPSLKAKNAQKQLLTATAHSPPPDPDAHMASEPTLSSLARLAASSDASFNESTSTPEDGTGKTKEQIRRHYLRTLHKVIDDSDIILLVLDSRDPEGCRSRLVEEEVRRRESEGKKLVFVLNKVDLIPRANAQAWLKYLRHSTPTLPFLAPSSAQHQRSGISSSTAPALLKLLKAYKPRVKSMTVGVVGYPNVGKSSLINCLKRSKVCSIAAQPGHTKELQSVQLERGLRIIDSPGVIFDDDDEAVSGKGTKKGSVLLRNVVKVEDIEDPIAVVEEIVNRTPKETLQQLYGLPDFDTTLTFLTMWALQSGKLLKGGTPDLNGAARQILRDWNQQKIPYFSEPPTIHPSLIPSTVSANGATVVAPGAENVGQAQILIEFSKPFELEGLFGAADAGAFGGSSGDVPMISEEGNAEEGEMIMDEPAPHLPLKRPRSPSTVSAAPTDDMETMQHPIMVRQSKRQRRSKGVPGYNDPLDEHITKQMERSNPLNRKVLKKDAKRARKAWRAKHASTNSASGMEIDGEDLSFTFMAQPT
ncbi:P-loop containing nucleoside triphosphate hydrolase protein, partial [Pluteus cervinus]